MNREYLSLVLSVGVLLLSGITYAEGASTPIERGYVCGECADQASARDFLEENVAFTPCDPEEGEPDLWNDEPVPGTTCSAPAEYAVTLEPESGAIFAFHIERQSRAEQGLAPRVVPAPSVLESGKLGEYQYAARQVRNYRDMVDSVNEKLNRERPWERPYLGPVFVPYAAYGVNGCPDDTALAALSTPSRYESMKQEVEQWARERFLNAEAEEPDVLTSRGWSYATENRSIQLATAGRDIRVEGYYDFAFQRGEGDFGYWLREHEDYLVFNYWVMRDPETGELISTSAVDLEVSRVNGTDNYMNSPIIPEPTPNGCLEQHSRQVLINGHGFEHMGGKDWNWYCDDGHCCLEASNLCLPEGMHERIGFRVRVNEAGERILHPSDGPGIVVLDEERFPSSPD